MYTGLDGCGMGSGFDDLPVNKLVDPENHQFLMETSLPTPMIARVYVNLPEGMTFFEYLYIPMSDPNGAGMKNANIKGVFLDGIHGTPYIAAPWILWDIRNYKCIIVFLDMDKNSTNVSR